MAAFATLHDEIEDQQERSGLFREMLLNADSLHLYDRERLPVDCFVIGVAAAWSIADLQMLDLIIDSGVSNKFSCFVFDFNDFKSHSEFEKHFPGIGIVYQSPVFVKFFDGVIQDRLTGFDARRRLNELATNPDVE